MRMGRNEIIEELTEHIRRSGGEPGEWRVGTAKEVSGARCQVSATGEPTCRPQLIDDPSFQHQGEAGPGDGFAYREAHTSYAAADAVDYLVSAFGLQLDSDALPGAERCSAPTANADLKVGGAVAAVSDRRTAVGTPPLQEAERSPRRPLQGAPEPGRLVFIYRKAPPAAAAATPPTSDHAAFPRRAA